jgi:hypothetical protein
VLSTTEAEFLAACDAGKSILYVRSILDKIGLPQQEATILFIDNNGVLPFSLTSTAQVQNWAVLA